MLNPSIQNLLLALIVVVPGFIATHFATSLGVFRTKLSKWRILITSLVMSLVVVTLFLAIVEYATETTVNTPTQVGGVFFTPTFRPVYVMGLLLLSAVVGVIGAILLVSNAHKSARNLLWDIFSRGRKRNFHEPWEGTLDQASRVQILTSDGAIAVGSLVKYSDDDKEKQISLTDVEWRSPSSDGFVDSDTDIELFFGEDIKQVTVVDAVDSSGRENRSSD